MESPILDGFHRFYQAYEQGLADPASADLSAFSEPDPLHALTSESVNTRYAEVSEADARIEEVTPLARGAFIDFWSVSNAQALFQNRLARMGMAREYVPSYVTLEREIFTTLNPDLNAIASRLAGIYSRSSASLQELAAAAALALVSTESDHVPNDLRAPTGVEFDTPSASRLRAFKFYISDLLGLTVI